MTQQDREKTREEFVKLAKLNAPHLNNIGIEAICDFWISKLDSTHTDTLQKVEKLKQEFYPERKINWEHGFLNTKDGVDGYNQGITDVLSAIRNIE